MLAGFRHSRRLAIILLILGYEWCKPGRRTGQKLAATLERLGPAFIKLGQALSTRSDLIGDQVAEDLSHLRDHLPPFAPYIARMIVKEEFDLSTDVLFSQFNDVPVAAASIAQVHRAVTKNGRVVAVKILRPGIERAFSKDLELFFWLADIIEHRAISLRRFKPLEIVRTLKESVFFELDLRLEAAAATELADNIRKGGDTGFRVPAIDWTLTSRRVMTMDWVEGISLSDVEGIRAAGISPDAVLTKAANSLFAQVFRDGFFHADLHPGNLFVDKNGDLVAVDFGIMGRLDWASRVYMAQILRGFLNGDYRRVAEVHFDAGYVPKDKSVDAFAQACRGVAMPITGKPLNEISIAKLLGQMFRIAGEFEMEVQPQLLLLQKTMMVTEGVGRMLNPNLNMWSLAQPLMELWATEHFGPAGRLKEAAQQGADALRKLPVMLKHVENALTMLDTGGIKLHPQSIAKIDADHRRRQRGWLTLAWVTLATAVAFGLAFLL